MARFTIIVLLTCLGVLGYLHYQRLTSDNADAQSLKDRIQFLSKENDELKARKVVVDVPHPKVEPPRIEAHPVITPVTPPPLEIRKGEPLRPKN